MHTSIGRDSGQPVAGWHRCAMPPVCLLFSVAGAGTSSSGIHPEVLLVVTGLRQKQCEQQLLCTQQQLHTCFIFLVRFGAQP